jgi:hypothetical protein
MAWRASLQGSESPGHGQTRRPHEFLVRASYIKDVGQNDPRGVKNEATHIEHSTRFDPLVELKTLAR